MYNVDFTDNASAQMRMHVRAGNKQILRKIQAFLEELQQHPTTGTGKPERLRQNLTGKYSRRINDEHRLVYEIDEPAKIVVIHSCYGHYD